MEAIEQIPQSDPVVAKVNELVREVNLLREIVADLTRDKAGVDYVDTITEMTLAKIGSGKN